MSILNLHFLQASIKECMLAPEQDRYELCTLQPSRILTMLLSLLTSATLFRYPACTPRFDRTTVHVTDALETSYKICHFPHIKDIWREKKELNLQRERIRQTGQLCMAEVLPQSQPEPASQAMMSPAVGRQPSIELRDIQRDRASPFRGVC